MKFRRLQENLYQQMLAEKREYAINQSRVMKPKDAYAYIFFSEDWTEQKFRGINQIHPTRTARNCWSRPKKMLVKNK